ncbi:MAG: PC4/YdbC family ssDNA-binding protein [Endomicrobia bacterium]|nr:PC4/YdbC family ssDNA-binding protein [Endomicrobiia bacterium]
MAEKAKPEIKFEIVQTLGTVSEGSKGWKKELNLVKWNDRDPKYDLRDWSPDRTKMGKGVTLTKEEVSKLKEILAGI